jgi:hypothetical protein
MLIRLRGVVLRPWSDYLRLSAYSCWDNWASDWWFCFLRLLSSFLKLLLVFCPEIVVKIQKFVLSFQITVSLWLLGIIVVKLFISDLLSCSSDWWTSKSSEDLCPLFLALPPLSSPLLLPFPHSFSVTHLSLSYLVAEVHRSKSVHQAVLILETLLSHVQSFLHGHCESYTKRKDKASE